MDQMGRNLYVLQHIQAWLDFVNYSIGYTAAKNCANITQKQINTYWLCFYIRIIKTKDNMMDLWTNSWWLCFFKWLIDIIICYLWHTFLQGTGEEITVESTAETLMSNVEMGKTMMFMTVSTFSIGLLFLALGCVVLVSSVRSWTLNHFIRLYIKGDSNNIFLWQQLENNNEKRGISKLSVHSNFSFTSYACLCALVLLHRLLC